MDLFVDVQDKIFGLQSESAFNVAIVKYQEDRLHRQDRIRSSTLRLTYQLNKLTDFLSMEGQCPRVPDPQALVHSFECPAYL